MAQKTSENMLINSELITWWVLPFHAQGEGAHKERRTSIQSSATSPYYRKKGSWKACIALLRRAALHGAAKIEMDSILAIVLWS